MDSAWTGTLGAADRALPRNMWGATPRAFVAAALPLLGPATSPTLQNLARRLLLSDAVAPPGRDPADGPGLFALRVERLLALGQVDAGVQLLAAVAPTIASDSFDRNRIELSFAANDLPGACGIAQGGAAHYQNPWWDRALIACQALSGQTEQAGLGLSLLREQKAPPDAAFDALIETIAGHRQKLDKLPNPTPLYVALLAAAKLPLPADALAAAGPAALYTYATSDKVPVLQRLPAAEKAMAWGALPAAALGLLYASVDLKAEEQAAALKNGKPPEDARGRALFYTIARNSDQAATRVAALRPLLADARRRGALIQTAQLVAPLVAELQPGDEMKDFAGDAARILLVTGHADETVQGWIALAATRELQLVGHLAKADVGAAAPPLLHDAMVALAQRDGAAAPHQADLLVALLAALDGPIANLDWGTLLTPVHPGALPAAALWIDQQQAAAAQRIGETVLSSLLLAAAGDHLTPEPVVLSRVLAGLEAAGLDADARALAVEAALAAGI
jgi:hypothetical protein